MPYIKSKTKRHALDKIIKERGFLLKEKGCLNYFLFKFAKETCKNYEDFRNLLGDLEMVKNEIYRRQIIRYEDKKIVENGDVK